MTGAIDLIWTVYSVVFPKAVKDENDTPINFSKKATSEALADEVQSRMCANNFQKRSIKTNRKMVTADEGGFHCTH
ncbi:hypothetical protein T265_14340, partial [Opisthorchis viverrini]